MTTGSRFTVFEESERREDDTRRLAIVLLTADEQLADERRWHDLFREHVGTHTDFDEHGKRLAGEVRPASEHHKFYDVYRPRDYTANEVVVGWFEI